MIINKQRRKKPFIIAAAVLVAVSAGYLVYASANKLAPFSQKKTELAQPGQQKVDLKKSDTEKQATKALQDNPKLKTQNNQTDTPLAPTDTTQSGKTVVNVLLTNAGINNGTVSASGFVTNIVEDGGTCTYTFTNGSQSVKKTATTLRNPTSTTCESVHFSSAELPASGTWKVILAYDSTDATGTSNQQEFTK